MIDVKKVKDFSKANLNSQDVMVKAVMIDRKAKSIILPQNMGETDRNDIETWEIRIINIGDEVKAFKIGDYAELKGTVNYTPLNDKTEEELKKGAVHDRISVFHMNMIEFSINPDNYDKTTKKSIRKK